MLNSGFDGFPLIFQDVFAAKLRKIIYRYIKFE